jgi:competence protein ComEC
MLIISVVLFLKSWSYKRIVFVLVSIVCVQLAFVYNEYHSQSEEFIVFNQYKTTFIGEKSGRKFLYSAENLKYTNSLDTYVVNEFIQFVEKDSLKNVYRFKDKYILVVDNKSIYYTRFKPNIVVLTGSPKLNLERLISIIKPELIVIDNNNYKSYVSRWKETCMKNKVPFHHTRKSGAFVMR